MDFPTHQATSDSIAKTENITTDRSWEGPSQEKIRQRGADYKACIRNWDGTEINEGKTTGTAIDWGYQEYKRKKYTNAILEMLFFGVKVSTHQTPNVESCDGRSFFYARDWL